MKMKLLYFIIASMVLFFWACSESGEYSEMVESMMIRNQSLDTLLVEIPALNQAENTIVRTKILPQGDIYWQVEKDSYELWMKESELLAYFSKLKMWYVTQEDTTLIDKTRYSKMTDWQHYLHTDYWFGTVTYFNSHSLTINR